MVPLAYRSLHVRTRNCLLIVAPSPALWNGLKAVLTSFRPKIGTARPPDSQISSDPWNCLYREYSGVLREEVGTAVGLKGWLENLELSSKFGTDLEAINSLFRFIFAKCGSSKSLSFATFDGAF